VQRVTSANGATSANGVKPAAGMPRGAMSKSPPRPTHKLTTKTDMACSHYRRRGPPFVVFFGRGGAERGRAAGAAAPLEPTTCPAISVCTTRITSSGPDDTAEWPASPPLPKLMSWPPESAPAT